MSSTSNTSNIETTIVRKIVSAALNSNWRISVFDGDRFRVKESIDACAIMNAVMWTDNDLLSFRAADSAYLGSVYLLYGNGYAVIADNSSGHVDTLLKPIVQWIDEHNN